MHFDRFIVNENIIIRSKNNFEKRKSFRKNALKKIFNDFDKKINK